MDKEHGDGVATCTCGEAGEGEGGASAVDGRAGGVLSMCEAYIFAGFTEDGGRIIASQGAADDLVALFEELDLALGVSDE